MEQKDVYGKLLVHMLISQLSRTWIKRLLTNSHGVNTPTMSDCKRPSGSESLPL